MKPNCFLALSLLGAITACPATGPTAAPDASAQADTSSVTDAGSSADTGEGSPAPQRAFTHKMMKRTGENMFAQLGYECSECSFEHHANIDPPRGWTKGPTQVSAFTRGELRSSPSLEGVPEALDFVDEVPGAEYQLIVKTLNGEFIERAAGRIAVRVEVMRDTRLVYEAGHRVHELTDPSGDVFVLFTYGVDPNDVRIPDFEDAQLFGDFTAPQGWTYATRLLDDDLVLDTQDTTTVVAIRGPTVTNWELRAP